MVVIQEQQTGPPSVVFTSELEPLHRPSRGTGLVGAVPLMSVMVTVASAFCGFGYLVGTALRAW